MPVSSIRSLAEQVRLADIKLQQTRIVAPVSGFVLNVHTHEDELVGQRALLTFADLSQFVCVLEIDVDVTSDFSTSGRRPRLSAARLVTKTRSRCCTEKITRIGRMVDTASLQPLSPLEPVDRRIVKVVAEIDSDDRALSKIVGSVDQGKRPALVGLQVKVRIPINANRDL